MTFRLRRLIILTLVLTLMVSIAGCEIFTTTQTPQMQSDTPYFMLNQLPEIGDYVDDLVYTRRYPETREDLAPGGDYGKLIPFVGSFKQYHLVDFGSGQWLDETMRYAKYGLMTQSGEIIVDAVYDGVSMEHCPDGEYLLSLYQNETDEETVTKRLICNSDGSWVMTIEGNIYCNLSAWSDGYVITTDYSQVNYTTQTGGPVVTFYDLKANKLFAFQNCTINSTEGFRDGYIILDFFTDYYQYEYESLYVNINGKIAFPGIQAHSPFVNGKASARNSDGLCGLLTTQGKWLISPIYQELYKSDDYYIASNGFDYFIFDLSGNEIATIDGAVARDQYIRTNNGRVYLEHSAYNALQGEYLSTYTDAFTGRTLTRKDSGRNVTSRFYDTEYFYCDDGKNTYIVDYDGNTVATLEGVGSPNKINDEFFSFTHDNRMDDTQLFCVYSFQNFQKLWSQVQGDVGAQVYFWDNSGYIIKTRYVESDSYVDYLKSYNDILDITTGKPVFTDLTDYRFFDLGEDIYLSCTDDIYTYNYDPQLSILMRIRNNETD